MPLPPHSAFNVRCRPGPLKIRHRVAGIVTRGDDILVTGYELNGKRFHSLPGGGQEPGETAVEALTRELAEETGCTASIGRLGYVAETFFADPFDARPLHLIGLYFHADLSGEPRLGFASLDAPEARIMTEVRFRDRRSLADITFYPVGMGEALNSDWNKGAPARYLRLPATQNTLGEFVTGVKRYAKGGIRPRGVAVVFCKDGRILTTFNGREWALPGGAVEPDELLPEAVTREIAEESGLIVEPLRLLFVNDNFFSDPVWAPGGLHELGFYWLCKLIGGEFDPGPHPERFQLGEDRIELHWQSVDELQGKALYPRWLFGELERGVREGWPSGTRYLVSGKALAR